MQETRRGIASPENNNTSVFRRNVWSQKLLLAFQLFSSGVGAGSLKGDASEDYSYREKQVVEGLVNREPQVEQDLGSEKMKQVEACLLSFNFGEYDRILSEITGISESHLFYQPMSGFDVLSTDRFDTEFHLREAWGQYDAETNRIQINASRLNDAFPSGTQNLETGLVWHVIAHENSHRLDTNSIGDPFTEGVADLVTRMMEVKKGQTSYKLTYILETLSVYFLGKSVGLEEFLQTYFLRKNMSALLYQKFGSEFAKNFFDARNAADTFILLLDHIEQSGGSIEEFLNAARQDVDIDVLLNISRDQNHKINGFVLIEENWDKSLQIRYHLSATYNGEWSGGNPVIVSMSEITFGEVENLDQLSLEAFNIVHADVENNYYRNRYPSGGSRGQSPIYLPLPSLNMKKIEDAYVVSYAKASDEERKVARQQIVGEVQNFFQEGVQILKTAADEDFQKVQLKYNIQDKAAEPIESLPEDAEE